MKTRYIKYLALPLMLASAWSCTDMTEDAVNETAGGSTVKEIVLQLPELKTADTRTEFTVDEVNKTLKTAWAEDDVAGIFPTTGYNQVEFPISDSWGESVARFDGGDWALRANKSYAAYFPFNKANFERDASSIILSYDGQVQCENGSVSHLSDYDYLATGAAQADPYGSIYFQMQRLSGIARFVFTLPSDETGSFIRLTLTADDEAFDVESALDITGGEPQLSASISSRSISLDLENISADENHQLIVYMTLPPMNVTQVKLMLTKDNGDMLTTVSDGFSIAAGKVQGYSFSDFVATVNTTIEFEDNLVKAICVDNWDVNGDGELGLAEAALVTALPINTSHQRFVASDITSFNELQYFTGLTCIDGGAFDRCSNLTSVVLPPSILKIEGCAFRDCGSLTDINFPENLTTIEGSAFESCISLTEVVLPASLTSLGASFNGCSSIVSMTFGNSKYSLYDETLIIEGDKTLGCLGNKAKVIIPDDITTIGERTFAFCPDLSEVVIPNTVEKIENYAFHDNCGVKDITIPESVSFIGIECFAGSDLTGILVNAETPPAIENDAFRDTNDCPIYVPSASVDAYKEAWSEYADRIYAINEDPMDNFIAFSDPEVKRICVESYDINSDGELSYEEAASVKIWGQALQNNEAITSFNEFRFFSGVTTISYQSFRGCSNLTSITLPNGLEKIEEGSFYECKSLANIAIPESVTSIGRYTFYETGITTITIPEGVTKLAEGIFSSCKKLNRVNLPSSLTNIGNFSFDDCDALTSITIPDGLVCIESSAFYGCDNLKTIIIPNSVTEIQSSAFFRCKSLQTMIIPNSVINIGSSAFSGCTNLSSVTIGSGVISIGNSVFSGCSSLTSVVIPVGVEIIPSAAFENCSSLTYITIPEGVKRIEGQSFWGCSSLKSVTIPSSVTYIGTTFTYCENLASITMLSTTPASRSFDLPNDNCFLYVPAESLETYKSTWTTIANNIKPIVE